MTLALTTKLKLFIQRMMESEEQAQWGFELLLKRENFEEYFDQLNQAGLFSSEKNPAPVSTDQPGYVHIPFWFSLNYLEAIAKLAGEKGDLDLGEKVMVVVRGVSHAREPDGSIRDNYHTWSKFAGILGLVPSTVVTPEDLDQIAVWLSSKYDSGMIGHALDIGTMQKFLTSDDPADWSKACIVLRHCTAVNWIEEKGFGESRKKPETAVDDYWLKELIGHHASNLGAKIGKDAANVFLDRLREVFGQDGHDVSSWLRRPAIEDHTQNHSWNGPENRFVEGLRDVLLSWVDNDISTAQLFIENLPSDDAEVVRRVGIYVLNQRWEVLCGHYLTVLGPQLFDSDHLHELYGLLRDHFSEFSDEQRAATVDAIRQIPLPDRGGDPGCRLRYIQRNWLSAITGKGYEPADAWFQELDLEDELGPLQSHPDFHSYMASWSGPGPSSYSVSELLAFADDGTIVERINGFQQTDSWSGPTTRALVDTLEDAVVQGHQQFLDVLPDFVGASRPYQYGIINGFKRVWDAAKDEKDRVDWERTWEAMVGFFESILGGTSFWTEQVVPDRDLTPTRDWIPPAIAEMLRSGTRNDEKTYPETLLPRAWALIECLLENLDPESEADEDAIHQAINSPRGKVVEALFSHALRECRVSDKRSGGHAEVWSRMSPAFEQELDKCKDANYEFSTLTGSYIANIEYMDRNWLQRKVEYIFPQQLINNFSCALEGLAYAPESRTIYALLLDSGVLEFALQNELKGRHSREKLIERVALAYLWEDDELDSPRFSCLFEPDKEDDLDTASGFFWSVSNQELTPDQINRVISFWEQCVEWSGNAVEPPAKLLSSLSRLSCYIDAVGSREEGLLHAVAPYVGVNYNAVKFIEELDRLAEHSPAAVSAVFRAMLDSHKPISDYQDRLKSLLTKLDASGLNEDAIVYADQLRYINGMRELFDQLQTGG